MSKFEFDSLRLGIQRKQTSAHVCTCLTKCILVLCPCVTSCEHKRHATSRSSQEFTRLCVRDCLVISMSRTAIANIRNVSALCRAMCPYEPTCRMFPQRTHSGGHHRIGFADQHLVDARRQRQFHQRHDVGCWWCCWWGTAESNSEFG